PRRTSGNLSTMNRCLHSRGAPSLVRPEASASDGFTRLVVAILAVPAIASCRPHGRPVCEAQPPLDILAAEGTDAENMPSLTRDPAAVEWPGGSLVRSWRDLGEPPLTRAADRADAARCLFDAPMWGTKVVARIERKRNQRQTTLSVLEAHACRAGPPWVVGR